MPSQQKQIECTIQDVEHNVSTGWYTILTDRGKFTTKHRERAEEALANKGKLVLLLFDESVVTKPAADGSGNRTYTNRYYSRSQISGTTGSSVADSGGFTTTGAPESSASNGGGFTQSRGEDPEKNWRICLQTGAKLAVWLMPMFPPEQQTFDVQKEIALAWGRFFFFTPAPSNVMPDLRGFDDAPHVPVPAGALPPDEDPWAGLETQ